mmetsp:Transcript_23741/g.67088  ORF Transcript_23741/g.67088 Transcript_23741/m.67088 type:complete len:109 (+) Transcript_23741:523-849(+)
MTIGDRKIPAMRSHDTIVWLAMDDDVGVLAHRCLKQRENTAEEHVVANDGNKCSTPTIICCGNIPISMPPTFGSVGTASFWHGAGGGQRMDGREAKTENINGMEQRSE